MLSVIKQIVACLVIASLVATACYYLPFVNSLFGDYLIGFFLAAFLLPIGMKWYESHMTIVRKASQNDLHKPKKACNEWHGISNGSSTDSNCYDQRNIDQKLHIFDGLKK